MKTKARAIALACVVIATALACGPGKQESAAKSISGEELAAAIAAGDEPFVLDVRTEAEFADGHIPGAVNVPHDQLAERLAELPSDRSAEIVVHCKSGRRAQAAETILLDAGFTDVRDLAGHMDGWREDGRPIE